MWPYPIWIPLRYVIDIYCCWTLFLQWLNLQVMEFHSDSTLEFEWNSMECPWDSSRAPQEFCWNSTGNPWESTGMVHSYHSWFWWNLPELMEEGNSHLKILVAQDIVIIDLLNYNLWHIVWYCVSHSHIVKVGRPKNMAIFLLVSAVTVWNEELYRCISECNFDDLN